MFTLSNRKPNFVRIFAILVLLLGFIAITAPAGAMPPQEEIIFDPIIVTYAQGNFTSVNGVWSSSAGLFEGAGNAVQSARHSGWPGNGWQFNNGHFMTTLSDGNGTITIQDQTTGLIWTGLDATASGHWVIKDGTGAYAGLHGQGTSTLVSIFHFSCPDASVTGVCIIVEMNLSGLGHFEQDLHPPVK